MIAVIALKCQKSHVRTAFLLVLGAMLVWSAGTVLEMDFRMLTGITYMMFINICYIGICLVPVFLLYCGRVIFAPEWQPKPVHAVFFIVPAASIAVIFTNQFHHLFFTDFSLVSSEAVYGIYYYFHSVYSYGCIAAGIILMLVSSARNSGLLSRQSLLVIAAVVFTVIPNMLYSFGIAELPFSISMAAFTVSIFLLLVAFFKYRFIATLPITIRQIVDLISDGYLVTDRQHHIISFNRALIRMFPMPLNITPGNSVRDFMDGKFLNVTWDHYLQLYAQAAEHNCTVTAEFNIAETKFLSAEITPVFQHNTQTGCIILLKDITQSKQLIELTKTESRYKSEFLSNMSHEIRTPMNAIIGMVNIGKSAADMAKKDYSLTRIEEASRHLLGIINNILDISKIEAGKFGLSAQEFIFEKMIRQAVNVVKFRADEKKQSFAVYIDNGIPGSLIGDDQHLAQVITNLIGNAVKFTPENGSIKLDTKLVEKNDEQCTVQFDIADSGIGISPEQQARLFQSYSQAEDGTARKFGGTGLGLAISKNIVEMMGGRIWIESELGKGAVFSFTVKLARGTGEGLSEQQEDTNSEAAVFTGSKILLAEDVEVNREIVLAMLEPTRIEVDCAENGLEAVRMFSEDPEKYDMIFMDLQMPQMDGYEATRRIRIFEEEHRKQSGEHKKNIPIIAMTASVFREDIEKCILSGMNGHVGKPLNLGEVIKQLKLYIKTSPGQTGLTA